MSVHDSLKKTFSPNQLADQKANSSYKHQNSNSYIFGQVSSKHVTLVYY